LTHDAAPEESFLEDLRLGTRWRGWERLERGIRRESSAARESGALVIPPVDARLPRVYSTPVKANNPARRPAVPTDNMLLGN
jgi:hypothetical protein